MADARTPAENVLLAGIAVTALAALLGYASERGAPQPVPLGSDGMPSQTYLPEAVPAAATDPFESMSNETCYAVRGDAAVRTEPSSNSGLIARLSRGESFACRGLSGGQDWVRIEQDPYAYRFVARSSVSAGLPPALDSRARGSSHIGSRAIARRGSILAKPRGGAAVLQTISPPLQLEVAGLVLNTNMYEVRLRSGGVGYIDARVFEPDPRAEVTPTPPRNRDVRQPNEPPQPTSTSTPAPRPTATSPQLVRATMVTVPSLTNRTRMSRIDYPREAERRREEGTVAIRVQVNERGRASDCQVRQSSGSQALDEATCQAFMRSARFEAARDNFGKPIAAPWDHSITWSLDD